jgi:hypothetical protein
MVAMSMAQDEAIDMGRIEVEQIEVPDQHFGGIAKIQQISRPAAGLGRLQMQRQPPLAGEGRALMPRDVADMLDLDHRVLSMARR